MELNEIVKGAFEKAEVAGPGFLKRCGGRPRETLDFIGLDLENGLWRRSFLLILRSRGGLHNRVTRQIPVMPFTLRECEEYAKYKHLDFSRRQLAECYMAFGGVAYYWSLLQDGLSAAQNFDRLFFGVADEMRNEYTRLFSSLFKRPTHHMSIVEQLGKRGTYL